MARPARIESERLSGGTRAAALLHELASRVGAANPHQFARYFDQQTGMDTQLSGKWRLNFSGSKPLSAQQMKLLSRLDADVNRLHEDGPADLWKAIWGPLDALRSVLASELIEWRTFDMVLAEFEADLLLAERDHAPLMLSHLAKAVALYRLHRETDAIVPLGLDGTGICRCLRLCLDNDQVQDDLNSLGVRQAVDNELTTWIIIRSDMEVAWSSVSARWNALSQRLGWVD